MDLKEVMCQQVFVVVGDTLNPDKYACKIKNRLIENAYTAYGVGKELTSINQVEDEIDIIDLCINPKRGLELMRECTKPFKCVVLQPGAASDELCAFFEERKQPYIEGCLLVAMNTYAKF